MAVVGGGVIATEYASIFTALGVKVILIEPKERVLPFVDTGDDPSPDRSTEDIGP